MKRPSLVLLPWLLLSARAVLAAPDYVAAAVEDAQRPPEERTLDAWRKPAEVIAFAGIRPGDRIADYMSGNAYFTRIFSRIVGDAGRVYAFLPQQQIEHCTLQEIQGTLGVKSDPHYGNVKLLVDAGDRFRAPEPLDAIWLAQGYHDLHDAFMAPTDVAALNRALFAALKPGGVLIIIDHVAESGSGLRDTDTLHRIDPASIRGEVQAAGFKFEAHSALLRNPQDGHALPVFDAGIRHHTDQVILKFRKPLAALTPRASHPTECVVRLFMA